MITLKDNLKQKLISKATKNKIFFNRYCFKKKGIKIYKDKTEENNYRIVIT